MILADTSIWIDHLHKADATLAQLLSARAVCMHPAIIGELAVGNLPNRSQVLRNLGEMKPSRAASHAEVLALIDQHKLSGRGLGYVDTQLLAAVLLNGDRLWARDRHLRTAASELGIEYSS